MFTGYRKVKIEPTKRLTASVVEFWKAMDDLKQAEYNFQNATPEYFDVANATLTAARERVNAFSMWVKE